MAGAPPARGVPLTATFLMLIPLAFSEEFIEAATETFGGDRPWWYAPVLWDAVLLLILSAIVGALIRTGNRPIARRWWWYGVAVTIGIDAVLSALDRWAHLRAGSSLPVWAVLISLAGYLASLVLLLAGAVDAHPLALVRPVLRRRDVVAWQRLQATLPLIVGTGGAWIASVVWDYALSPRRQTSGDCANFVGAVNQEYFAQVSQIIPLLLVAIGLEAGMFRRLLTQPSPRAMVTITVIILAAAEVLAISTLPWSNAGCDRLAGWHEYVAFIMTIESCFVALAWLVWALLMRTRPERTRGLGRTAAGSRTSIAGRWRR